MTNFSKRVFAIGSILALSMILAVGGVVVLARNSNTWTDGRFTWYNFGELNSENEIISITTLQWGNSQVFARNTETHQLRQLLSSDAGSEVYDFRIINGRAFLLSQTGTNNRNLYRIDGRRIITIREGNILSFTGNETYLFYTLHNEELDRYQLMRSDFDGNDETVLATLRAGGDTWLYEFSAPLTYGALTIVGDYVVYSLNTGVGKVSICGMNHTILVTTSGYTLQQRIIRGRSRRTPLHFVIGDKIIITGYSALNGIETETFPTVVMDLDGNVVAIWGYAFTFVRGISAPGGRVYVAIEDMRNDIEREDRITGIHHVTDDFAETHRIEFSGSIYSVASMYMCEDGFIHSGNPDNAMEWTKFEVLEDGTLRSIETSRPAISFRDEVDTSVSNGLTDRFWRWFQSL